MASYRIATLDDARRAARCLLDFHQAANLPFKASAAWADALFRSCVTDDDRLALMHESGRGLLLGIIAPSMLGPFLQAHEIAWWVYPDCRGNAADMLEGYEMWALKGGAQIIGVASLAVMPEVERLYEARGYARLEQHWVKVV